MKEFLFTDKYFHKISAFNNQTDKKVFSLNIDLTKVNIWRSILFL